MASNVKQPDIMEFGEHFLAYTQTQGVINVVEVIDSDNHVVVTDRTEYSRACRARLIMNLQS